MSASINPVKLKSNEITCPTTDSVIEAHLRSHPVRKSWFRYYRTALARTWESLPRFAEIYVDILIADRLMGRFFDLAAYRWIRRKPRIARLLNREGRLFEREKVLHCTRDSGHSLELLLSEILYESYLSVDRTFLLPRTFRLSYRIKIDPRLPANTNANYHECFRITTRMELRNTWTLHCVAITPSTGLSAKGSKLRSARLMKSGFSR